LGQALIKLNYLKYVPYIRRTDCLGECNTQDMFNKITASRLKPFIFIIILLFLSTGCASTVVPEPPSSLKLPPSQRPYKLFDIWYYPIPSTEGYIEHGIASWYGGKFHGRPTSSGEIYDMYKVSAAHKTLPLGTNLKVTNLKTLKSIVVRVNDRGPFVAGRIIDLSFKAAQMLDIVNTGTVDVEIEAILVITEDQKTGADALKLDPLPDFRFGKFIIQVGAFKTLLNALQLKADLMGIYDQIEIKRFSLNEQQFYRVQIGIFTDLLKAQKEIVRLSKSGYQGTFIVAVEEE